MVRSDIQNAFGKTTMPNRYRWISAFWVLLIFVCGCQANDELKAVATVNGAKISLGDFNERLTAEMTLLRDHSSLKPEDYDRLKEGVLQVLIDEKIMLLRAGELNLSVSDAELAKRMEEIKEGYSPEGFEKVLSAQGVRYDAWKKALKTRMILEKLIASDVNARISATEEEGEDYYRVHRGEYTREQEAHVAQIVLRDREKAERVLKRLKAGEDFGKVAGEVSIGLEATRGGDLGWVSRGIMPEAIDSVIFSLPSGAISQVIKSPYGYHIFRIVEKQEGGRQFSELTERIMGDIRKQKEEQAYVLWLSGLRSQAAIKIDRALLKVGTIPESVQQR